MEELDQYEGAPHMYRRERLTVRDAKGAESEAWIYVVVSKQPHVPPSRTYLRAILAGARAVRLPPEYIAQLEALPAAEG